MGNYNMRKFFMWGLAALIFSLSAYAFSEPLYEAVIAGDIKQVQQLIAAGADVNTPATGKGGMTPLNYAAYGGHLEIVKLLLDKGADINARDSMSFTPLLLAAIKGYVDIQKELINRGADVKAAENSFGWTALHRAAANGYNDLISLLLDKGAEINAKNKNGETPLTIARQKGKTATAQLLQSRGARE